MRTLATAVLLILTAQASAQDNLGPEQLMDRIERLVVLPPNAAPLGAYGRNYKFAGPGKVVGYYQIPEKPYDRKMSCIWGGKPCTAEQIDKLVKEREILMSSQARPGQRRWFSGTETILMIADGGCRQITMTYDIAANRILSMGCNGR